jgi:hypothetical protein
MALVNKVWREGEFVPPGSEPGLTHGFPWRDAVETQAVRQIAAQRFPYPGPDGPALQTYTNLPARTLGVRDDDGSLLFPDIVVIDSSTTEVKLLGEVETARSLEEDASVGEKWKAFLRLGPLYLFVPMAKLDVARRLMSNSGVHPTGLRTWRHMAGMDFTDVVDVRL